MSEVKLDDLLYIDIVPESDQSIFIFRSNCEYKGKSKSPVRGSIALKHKQFKARPLMYARKYGLFGFLNITDEHREYLMNMAVNDVTRLQMQLQKHRMSK